MQWYLPALNRCGLRVKDVMTIYCNREKAVQTRARKGLGVVVTVAAFEVQERVATASVIWVNCCREMVVNWSALCSLGTTMAVCSGFGQFSRSENR